MSEDFDKQTIELVSERLRSRSSFDLLIQAYIFMGLTMFAGGIGFFLYSRYGNLLNEDEKIALAFSAGGLLFSGLSFLMMKTRQRRIALLESREEEAKAIGKFIEAWAEFESAAKNSAFGPLGEEESHTLRETFRKLNIDKKIGSIDSIRADELLRARNQLVHGRQIFSLDQIQRYTDDLVSLLSKIT